MEFQEVMRERFVAVIESATGQRVVGFISGNQQDPDMICEVFVLSPTDLVGSDELPDAGDGDPASSPAPRGRQRLRSPGAG